jgi:hypothetical protein
MAGGLVDFAESAALLKACNRFTMASSLSAPGDGIFALHMKISDSCKIQVIIDFNGHLD